jgi:hypothetical protein
MSTSNEPAQTHPHDLQFDQAEFTVDSPAAQSEPTRCTACKAPIADVYYEAGGKIVCAPCRDKIGALGQSGSRFTRALKALFLGAIAAAIGAILYYAIIRITGWNLGLVAVVVGVLVGGAVKAGSGNRGGLVYQILAVLLTYVSIVVMHVPLAIEAQKTLMRKMEQEEDLFFERLGQSLAEAEKNESEEQKNKIGTDEAPIRKADKDHQAPKTTVTGKAAMEGPNAAKPSSSDDSQHQRRTRLIGASKAFARARRQRIPAWQGWLFFAGLPIRLSFADPITGFIFLFALWEAWKINRRVQLAFSGPFRLSTPETMVTDIDSQEAGDEP